MLPPVVIQIAAFAYAILSRLAYVLFVGITLNREKREASEFRRFRRVASIVMNNDAAAFILLCVLTRNTLALPVSTTVSVITGAALVLVGLGTQLWAARTLGSAARSAAGSVRNRSRDRVASPPWKSIACSGVAARPSCRKWVEKRRPISGSVRNSVGVARPKQMSASPSPMSCSSKSEYAATSW